MIKVSIFFCIIKTYFTILRKIKEVVLNIVHGMIEIRNYYETGHRNLPEFKKLDVTYIKLAVSASSELALFYLSLVQLQK